MSIYISVISHGHCDLINSLETLKYLVNDFKVVVKSNKPNDCFDGLLLSDDFYWIDDNYYCGFGHNNNIVFNYCKNELGMSESDHFIVLNPDVIIDKSGVNDLVNLMKKEGVDLASINLYKNEEMTIHDHSIRNFPSFVNFFSSFLGLGNSSVINKNSIIKPSFIQWAAGSFLAFSAEHYNRLGGFDEKYFMYCEDIDICFRSHNVGVPVMYYPSIKAVHLAKHANRKILTVHFLWHLTSVVRFLFTKIGLTKPSSSL